MIELKNSKNKTDITPINTLVEKISKRLKQLECRSEIPKQLSSSKENLSTVTLKYFFLMELKKILIENNTSLSESSLKMLVNEFSIKKITRHYAQPGEIHISELKRNYVFKGVSSTTKQLYQEALDLSQRTSPGAN